MEKRFALIEKGVVLNVIVSTGDLVGQEWLIKNFGGTWIEVAENQKVGKGSSYDEENNLFYEEKPFESWIFDYSVNEWVPPVDRPTDWKTKPYLWDEVSQSWILN